MAGDGPWSFKAGRLTGQAWKQARRVGKVAKRLVTKGPAGQEDPQMAAWYANLEIPYGSELDEVHRARKRLLARYHPDRYATDPDAARRAHELVLAIHDAHAQLVKRLSR